MQCVAPVTVLFVDALSCTPVECGPPPPPPPLVQTTLELGAKPIDESNIGNKMLKAMGWKGEVGPPCHDALHCTVDDKGCHDTLHCRDLGAEGAGCL